MVKCWDITIKDLGRWESIERVQRYRRAIIFYNTAIPPFFGLPLGYRSKKGYLVFFGGEAGDDAESRAMKITDWVIQ